MSFFVKFSEIGLSSLIMLNTKVSFFESFISCKTSLELLYTLPFILEMMSLISKLLMSRSKWKAPAAQMITSKSRVILPSDVASSISVSTGKTQLTFKVVQPMVGHRVGEFYLVHKFAVSKKKTNVRGKR